MAGKEGSRALRDINLCFVFLLGCLSMILNLYMIALVQKVDPSPPLPSPYYYIVAAMINGGYALMFTLALCTTERGYAKASLKIWLLSATFLSAITAGAAWRWYIMVGQCAGAGQWTGGFLDENFFCVGWQIQIGLAAGLSLGLVLLFVTNSALTSYRREILWHEVVRFQDSAATLQKVKAATIRTSKSEGDDKRSEIRARLEERMGVGERGRSFSFATSDGSYDGQYRPSEDQGPSSQRPWPE